MIKIPSCLIMVVLHYMFLREHCVISPEVDIYLIYEFEIPLKARGKKKANAHVSDNATHCKAVYRWVGLNDERTTVAGKVKSNSKSKSKSNNEKTKNVNIDNTDAGEEDEGGPVPMALHSLVHYSLAVAMAVVPNPREKIRHVSTASASALDYGSSESASSRGSTPTPFWSAQGSATQVARPRRATSNFERSSSAGPVSHVRPKRHSSLGSDRPLSPFSTPPPSQHQEDEAAAGTSSAYPSPSPSPSAATSPGAAVPGDAAVVNGATSSTPSSTSPPFPTTSPAVKKLQRRKSLIRRLSSRKSGSASKKSAASCIACHLEMLRRFGRLHHQHC